MSADKDKHIESLHGYSLHYQKTSPKTRRSAGQLYFVVPYRVVKHVIALAARPRRGRRFLQVFGLGDRRVIKKEGNE